MVFLKSHSFSKLFLLLLVLAALGACGDRSLDEFQRSELERELAEKRQVAGRYTGLVYSKRDKSLMGAMSLDIRVETRSQSGAAESGGRAVLVTVVEFVDQDIITIDSDNGYFDLSSKQFQTNITLAQSPQVSEDLSIGGRLEGDYLNGSIAVIGYAPYGGSFKLQKNGPDPATLISGRLPQEDERNDGLGFSQVFKGRTIFRDNRISPVQLVISQQSSSSAEDFLNKFVPVKSVQLSISFGDGALITHLGSRWDQRTRLLTGSWTSEAGGRGSAAFRVNTECRQSGSAASLRWNCVHASSSLGQVASTLAVDLRSEEEFETDSFSQSSEPVRVSFDGTATFDKDGSRTTRVGLVVTQPAETRATQIFEAFFPVREKNVHANLQIFSDRESSIPIFFNAASTIWDRESGQLNGVAEVSSGAEKTNLQLRCQGFFLDRTSRDFACEYMSSRLLYPFDMRFKVNP